MSSSCSGNSILSAEHCWKSWNGFERCAACTRTFIFPCRNKLAGKKGTPRRDRFEYGLRMELISQAIKETRRERRLTQEELGRLIGIQKAQLSAWKAMRAM